jgi:hypothetical protein
VRDEQVVHLEKAIELSETEADTAVDERLVRALIQDSQVDADGLVCRLHVDEDVVAGSRRGSAVLVAATLDCHGDLVVFGVSDRGDDVLVVFRLDDQCRVHVVVQLVGGCRILVVVVLVGLSLDGAFCCPEVLYAGEALDGSHGRSVVMRLG